VPSFDARLHLPGRSRLPLQVVVDVTDEQIVITSGREQIGAWALQGVEVVSRPDGFHLTLDQEEIILNVADPARFASQLELSQLTGEQDGRSRVADAGDDVLVVDVGASRKRAGIAGRLEAVDLEERFGDVRRRISALATALTDELVAPSDLFGRWLRLLKEINRHHGQGAMPTPLFYRLNTELLDLIPAPPGPLPPQVAESMERASQPRPT
jgi:hypothetical protein